MTQFGYLKHLLINDTGTYLNEAPLSPLTLSDYRLTEGNFISFRLGVREDACYVGGLNLFGEKFGDFPQSIQMIISY